VAAGRVHDGGGHVEEEKRGEKWVPLSESLRQGRLPVSEP
jgi:hypothetical protein